MSTQVAQVWKLGEMLLCDVDGYVAQALAAQREAGQPVCSHQVLAEAARTGWVTHMCRIGDVLYFGYQGDLERELGVPDAPGVYTVAGDGQGQDVQAVSDAAVAAARRQGEDIN